MKLIDYPSPNFDERAQGSAIDKLVLHYTGMPNLELSLSRLGDSSAKVSSHYLIDEIGLVYQLVNEEMRAWHAGISYWSGQTDINSQSIGIELQNPGHEWGYQEFPDAQIEALVDLATSIINRHNISAKQILGHSDIAPERKKDPGEFFPWDKLATQSIGYWPTVEKINTLPIGSEDSIRMNLSLIGYDPKASFSATVTAFQRHFRPAKVDGIVDMETAQLVAACAKIA